MPAWFYVFWGTLFAFFAVYAAVLHHLGLVIWNAAWTGIYIHLYIKAREAGR